MPDGAAAKLVLVVDDFPESVDGLFEALAENGFSVALAMDGEDGIRAVRERRPDVIIMDLAMPRLDGLAAARRLKADPATCMIPVIIFTEHPGHELKVIADAVGCFCVLGKHDGSKAVVDALAGLWPKAA